MNRRSSRSAAIVIAAMTTLLAAACSASPASTGSPNTGGSNSSPSTVAWVQCVRSHGIPDFPDPDSGGQIPKITSGQQVGVSDSVLQAARTACQNLWPYQAPSQAQQQQELAEALTFAHCMRSHGVLKFPDPTTNSESGRVEFVISLSRDGFNLNSPQILAKVSECEHGLPASLLQGPEGVEATQVP
jgi:hypothetical protein